MKKISINLSDEVYDELKNSSELNERTLSGEIIYRIKMGVPAVTSVWNEERRSTSDTADKKIGAGREWEIPSPGVGSTKSEYQEVIDKIEGSLDRDLDYDESKELKVLVESSGLKWNAYRRRLEKVEGSGYKIIHQF